MSRRKHGGVRPVTASARSDEKRRARTMALLAWVLPALTGAFWGLMMARGSQRVAIAAGLLFAACLLAAPALSVLALRRGGPGARMVAGAALGAFVLFLIAWAVLASLWSEA